MLKKVCLIGMCLLAMQAHAAVGEKVTMSSSAYDGKYKTALRAAEHEKSGKAFDTMLEYVIVASALVMWPPATSLAFCLKSSILILNTILHHTNWWPMGTDFLSGKTSNATLTFSISLDIASAHKVLPFLASRA